MTLTVQQHKVVDFIQSFRAEHDMSPTVREIADHLGVTLSTAQHHVDRLVHDAVLHRATVPGNPAMTVPRGLRIVMKASTETF